MLLFPRPPEGMLEWAVQIQKWGKGTQMCMAGVAVLFKRSTTPRGWRHTTSSSLTNCLSGAGPLPRDVQLKFEEKVGAKVVEGYGLRESSRWSRPTPLSLPKARSGSGSIGIPSPTRCKFLDLETGERQLGFGPDEVGELCVKGAPE